MIFGGGTLILTVSMFGDAFNSNSRSIDIGRYMPKFLKNLETQYHKLQVAMHKTARHLLRGEAMEIESIFGYCFGIIFGICLIGVPLVILIYLANNRHFSKIKLGIGLVTAPIVYICLTNLNDGYLYKKLFWTPTRLEMGHGGSEFLILFPIPQDDGTIRLMTPLELNFELEPELKEKDDVDNIILNSDQIMNFRKLGLINEPSYYFSFHSLGIGYRSIKGSIKIDNGYDGWKKIELHMKSFSRTYHDYIGNYEIKNNKMKLLSASYNLENVEGGIFVYFLAMLSFIDGLLLIIIATIRKIWPPTKKHSFLNPILMCNNRNKKDFAYTPSGVKGGHQRTETYHHDKRMFIPPAPSHRGKHE